MGKYLFGVPCCSLAKGSAAHALAYHGADVNRMVGSRAACDVATVDPK